MASAEVPRTTLGLRVNTYVCAVAKTTDHDSAANILKMTGRQQSHRDVATHTPFMLLIRGTSSKISLLVARQLGSARTLPGTCPWDRRARRRRDRKRWLYAVGRDVAVPIGAKESKACGFSGTRTKFRPPSTSARADRRHLPIHEPAAHGPSEGEKPCK